ncbi:uncharacterized protein zgc:123010 [Periophthalmus magnuspinnatus]|uniref:uncharacterized protein zgc:123010 n=1 Tax=Periophthalmus magnuspinnatus TaxID=409849 RepID=UPI00145A0AD1|nr:uncharacterized protein zgc:123010 [Periophthalmus magnuspinnatus]
MVALMKFTRDICWLLGLGSGPPVQEEHMDCGPTASDLGDDVDLSQDGVNGEEELSEGEKVRRRAERRRAKRKRRRKRKKQGQIKQNDQDDEEEEAGGESELDESDSEAEDVKDVQKEVKPVAVNKPTTTTTVTASPGIKAQQKNQSQAKSAEEEPEWDVSSAFFANAASHIRPKVTSRKSRDNKENETKKETNGHTDMMSKKSASLTEKGIKLVQEGQYAQAVTMFTEAIKCDPKDYRFFGNRSYCYSCLDQFPQALADAERSIQLAPDWPKGYFRKGIALMGMKRYSEAEKAMEKVLRLDKDCEEAVTDLFNCKVLQLMEHGLDELQSVYLLEKFTTVQAVLSSCSDAVKGTAQDPLALQTGPCPSLWVGNVTTELTEKHILDLFKTCGEIESIRVLHERFCAFVNFKDTNMAARAMEKLNGYCIENTRLVVRYPDRRTPRTFHMPLKNCLSLTQQAGMSAGARRRGPVNGDECYFWRTTGCHFGDKCRYKHIPDQKGKDRKPWQP